MQIHLPPITITTRLVFVITTTLCDSVTTPRSHETCNQVLCCACSIIWFIDNHNINNESIINKIVSITNEAILMVHHSQTDPFFIHARELDPTEQKSSPIKNSPPKNQRCSPDPKMMKPLSSQNAVHITPNVTYLSLYSV